MNLNLTLAELKAKEVLRACGLVTPIGIEMEEVILGRGAFYEEKPLVGKEGEMVSTNGKSFISVNSNSKPEQRRRFIAAHELGHYELHRNLEPIFSDTDASLLTWYQEGSHEQEANYFAAEFLMPSEVFVKKTLGRPFSPALIDELSYGFRTSVTSTILKYVSRGPHPIFVAYSQNNIIKWMKRTQGSNYWCTKLNLETPALSVAHEFFTEGINDSGDSRKQKISKSDWFETVSKSSVPCYEWCIPFRSINSCLSIVWED